MTITLGHNAAAGNPRGTAAVDMTVNSQGSCAALGLPFLFDTSDAAFKVLEGETGAALAERFAARPRPI